jgi:hypothetical protein
MLKLSVEKADLAQDRGNLIRFLKENLTEASNDARFEWLYLGNPAGPAQAWIARDSDGQMVGVAAAFPRDFRVDTSPQRVWVLGDFCVSRACRTLGPALRLQRACLDFVAREFWYDFPSRKMMAIYRRIGGTSVGESLRYAKLLRVDSKVEQLVPAAPVARTLSRAGNSFLRLRSAISRSSDFQIDIFNGTFNEEFDELNLTSVMNAGIQGQRNSAFLNWRYRECPLASSIVLTARKAGRLVGYVAGTVRGVEATLADVRGSGPDTISAMIGGMEEVLRQKEVHTWNSPVFAGSDILNSLRRAGFYPREASPVVFNGGSHSSWLLWASDRDS